MDFGLVDEVGLRGLFVAGFLHFGCQWRGTWQQGIIGSYLDIAAVPLQMLSRYGVVFAVHCGQSRASLAFEDQKRLS